MVDSETLVVIRGTIPSRDRRAVMEWAAEHQDEIAAAWNILNPDLAI